jgi:hypothetical protein
MALLICPICLIWFKKTLCPSLYVLYALYGSKKLIWPYLYVLYALYGSKKLIWPCLYVLYALYGSKKLICSFMVKKAYLCTVFTNTMGCPLTAQLSVKAEIIPVEPARIMPERESDPLLDC